jgi:alpha-L-arabinofuranosidase
MKMLVKGVLAVFSCLLLGAGGCGTTRIVVELDVVLSDVSHHPIGINVDYFMDDDAYLQPKARSTTDALRDMGMKYLRYPGGNKSDFYFFSVEPYERSEPTLARTGKEAVGGSRMKALVDNREFKYDVLDFDEFMEMCRAIDGVPVICVAADEYLVDYPEGCTWSDRETLIKHAVEWVRYANIKKRYGVKYWMIGNETWHQQNENSTPEIYARDVVDFSRAMKAVDPSIKIIANGRKTDWWQRVLPICVKDIDYLTVSNYPVRDYKKGYLTYRDNVTDLLREVNVALDAIEKFTSGEDRERLKLTVAEYGSMDWAKSWPHINNMGHNLASFEMTGEQLKLPKLEFSCFWNTRWIHNKEREDSIFDALDRDGNFNANGYGLAIWGNFLAPKMVRTSSTVRVRSFGSYDPEKKQLFVYIVNKSKGQEAVSLNLSGYAVDSVVRRWEQVGEGPEDTEPVWRENRSGLDASSLEFVVPGTSITIIEYKLR